MSNFNCEICGAACIDSPDGLVTGCEHYFAHLRPEFAIKPPRQHISARLDAGLVAAIKERAEAERCTKTDLLERLLFEAMAEKVEIE